MEESQVTVRHVIRHAVLAVAQAAAYLDETGLSADEYLRLLDTRAAELLADEAPTGYSASLAASWQVVFDRLAADEPAALHLLTLCAHLAPEPTPSPCSPRTRRRCPAHSLPQPATR